MAAKRYFVMEIRYVNGLSITRQESCFNVKDNATNRAERLSKQQPVSTYKVYDSHSEHYILAAFLAAFFLFATHFNFDFDHWFFLLLSFLLPF